MPPSELIFQPVFVPKTWGADLMKFESEKSRGAYFWPLTYPVAHFWNTCMYSNINSELLKLNSWILSSINPAPFVVHTPASTDAWASCIKCAHCCFSLLLSSICLIKQVKALSANRLIWTELRLAWRVHEIWRLQEEAVTKSRRQVGRFPGDFREHTERHTKILLDHL